MVVVEGTTDGPRATAAAVAAAAAVEGARAASTSSLTACASPSSTWSSESAIILYAQDEACRGRTITTCPTKSSKTLRRKIF